MLLRQTNDKDPLQKIHVEFSFPTMSSIIQQNAVLHQWKWLRIGSRLKLCFFFLQKARHYSKWKLDFCFHFPFEVSTSNENYEEKTHMHQCLIGFPSPAWKAGLSCSIMASTLQVWWLWWCGHVLWRYYWTVFPSVIQNSSTEGEGVP